VKRAVFLDRDGTINREVDFVENPERLQLLPGARDAIHRLADAGFAIVVVTNQSGIARGLYGETDLARIHEKLLRETDGRIAAVVHCPHHPDLDGAYGRECDCRKPKGGLVLQGAELVGATLAGSYLVGDTARDVLAARGTPLRTVYVHSGKPPAHELHKLREAGFAPTAEAMDLAAAADWILRDMRGEE
jgi:D-glycero-D-manno-heptose 1,7-bisphosphate phosphatase